MRNPTAGHRDADLTPPASSPLAAPSPPQLPHPGQDPTSDPDLRAFLVARRGAAREAVAAAERNFQHILEAARSVSTDDEHDPEGVGLAVERAHVSASLAGARAYVSELEHALERVAAGTYGACETCGRPIGADRLLARPATRACIDCARTGAK